MDIFGDRLRDPEGRPAAGKGLNRQLGLPPRKPGQPRPLLSPERRPRQVVVDLLRAREVSVGEAGEEREASEHRGALDEHAIERPHEQERREIPHEVRTPSLLEPGSVPRLLCAAPLVVEDAQLPQHVDAPPPRLRAVLVDAVPSHRRAQSAYLLEAVRAIGLRHAVDVVVAPGIGPPALPVVNQDDSADDPRARVVGEGGRHPFEVVGREEEVSIHLHDQVGALSQGVPARIERGDYRRSSRSRVVDTRVDDRDPVVLRRERLRDRARPVLRPVVHDDPLLRAVGLSDDRESGRPEEALLVTDRGHDGVCREDSAHSAVVVNSRGRRAVPTSISSRCHDSNINSDQIRRALSSAPAS